MKSDLLACRHIGISEKDEEKMLRKIGVGSLDELIDKTIPANIRLKEPLALPEPMTEYEFGQHITRLACKNKLYTTYIGLVYLLYSLPDRSFTGTPRSVDELPDNSLRPNRYASCQLFPAG